LFSVSIDSSQVLYNKFCPPTSNSNIFSFVSMF
jgi:hypothetical protein